MNKTFKWGIIGCGKIAHAFAEDLQRTPNAQLHAVASSCKERAQSFADRYQVMHVYDSYAAMLDGSELDAVYIATRHIQHCDNTLLCLKRRLPALCEKPLAMNHAQVARMVACAKEHNTFLMEAIWTRFLPSTVKLLEIIHAGTIGELLWLRADFGFQAPVDYQGRLYNKALGGGALLDVGIYPLFLAQLLMGKPESIQAQAQFSHTGVDLNTAMLLSFANNQQASLDASIRHATPCLAHIHGSKGSIQIHSRWHESKGFNVHVDGHEPQDHHFDFAGCHGYRFEIEEVMHCVQAGQTESELLPLNFSLDLAESLDRVRAEIGLEYKVLG